MEHSNWYKSAVIYQIYPRSFKDSNNDGLGDIPGIIEKLDYVKKLGVDAIWISPVYKSPQKDNGYDISDYKDIYEPFGTLDDMKRLIAEAHKRDLKIIMDLVVNHTSDKHRWFIEAMKDKNSPYRDYYIIKKGKKNGKKAPNNWSSMFSGSAWERIGDSNEYYLHLFAKEQPDLNWENPKVREEIISVLRYWMDLGVDGFRCDVITLLSKDERYKNDAPISVLKGKKFFISGPRLHEYLHLLHEKAYKDYDVMTVGETVMASLDEMKKLSNPKNEELDMVFDFSFVESDSRFGVKYLYRKFELKNLRKKLIKNQKGIANDQGWLGLFIENHDQRRSSGRFGTDLGENREKSIKALATSYFFLKGTPFIYQGQELGMQNMDYTSIDDFQDVEIHNMYKLMNEKKSVKFLFGKVALEVSRDNARTPMQWDDSEFAGFSNVKPWLKVNANKNKINVENALNNFDSPFYYYQKLIQIKKKYPATHDGDCNILLPHNKNVLSYTRENKDEIILVVVNFANKIVKNPFRELLDSYSLLLSNEKDNKDNILSPYEARIYYKKK